MKSETNKYKWALTKQKQEWLMKASLAIGFAVALFTGNLGNILIFVGLSAVTYPDEFNYVGTEIGRVFYLLGIAFAIWTMFAAGLALGLGWFTVFVTLLVGSYYGVE